MYCYALFINNNNSNIKSLLLPSFSFCGVSYPIILQNEFCLVLYFYGLNRRRGHNVNVDKSGPGSVDRSL